MTRILPKAVFVMAWLLAAAGAIFISQHYASATRFFGIADDLEQNVRFASAIEIVGIQVVPGAVVGPEDVILNVRQPDLEAEIAYVKEQIFGLRFSERQDNSSIQTQIVQAREQLRVDQSRLDSELRTLRSRQVATRLLQESGEALSHAQASLQQEMQSVQQRKQALQRSEAALVASLTSRLDVGSRPIDAEIAELEERMAQLHKRRDALTVRASLAGRVGSVFFKVGDTVPPYQVVMTIHGAAPTFVRGYIHESVSNELRKDARVQVTAVSPSNTQLYYGVVESLGARIVEFPQRLKVNPMTQAWGREVIVRLEPQHDLLLGEKVAVQLEPSQNYMSVFKNKLAQVVP